MTEDISTHEKLGTLATDQLCGMLSAESNIFLAWLKIIVGAKKAAIPTLISKFFEYGLSTAGISATILTLSPDETGPSLLIRARNAATDSSAHVLAPWLQELYREASKQESQPSARDVQALVMRIKPPIEQDVREFSDCITGAVDFQRKLGSVLLEYVISIFTHDDRAYRLWVETTREPWPAAALTTLGQFLRELLQATGSTTWPLILRSDPSGPFVINLIAGGGTSGDSFNVNLSDWLQRYCAHASNKGPLTPRKILALIEKSDPPQRGASPELKLAEQGTAGAKTGGYQGD